MLWLGKLHHVSTAAAAAEHNAAVLLVVALLCSGAEVYGYPEDDTAHVVEEVFGAEAQDIAWVTPVLEEHFTYHSSVLAGRSRLCGLWHKADGSSCRGDLQQSA